MSAKSKSLLYFVAIDANPIRILLVSHRSYLVGSGTEFNFLACGGLSLSLSLCGGFEERDLCDRASLDLLIRCTYHYPGGVFVYVGLVGIDGCVVRIHNLQDTSLTELDCGYRTFPGLFNPLQPGIDICIICIVLLIL